MGYLAMDSRLGGALGCRRSLHLPPNCSLLTSLGGPRAGHAGNRAPVAYSPAQARGPRRPAWHAHDEPLSP